MNNVPQLLSIDFFSLEVSTDVIIWSLFALIIGLMSIIAGFLVYHWEQYEINKFRARAFEWLYFGIAFVLASIAAGGIIYHLYL